MDFSGLPGLLSSWSNILAGLGRQPASPSIKPTHCSRACLFQSNLMLPKESHKEKNERRACLQNKILQRASQDHQKSHFPRILGLFSLRTYTAVSELIYQQGLGQMSSSLGHLLSVLVCTSPCRMRLYSLRSPSASLFFQIAGSGSNSETRSLSLMTVI